jgi:hypothetical protein
MKILCGVMGALVGFFAGMFAFELLGLSNQHDPIMSGLLALFVFGPAGAITGAILGAKLAMRASGADRSANAGEASVPGAPTAAERGALTAKKGDGLAVSTLRSLGIIVAIVTIAGTAYYAYAVATATPWLNPNAANPVLQFEIRLPSGTTLPTPRDVEFELQTDLNRMPGEVRVAKFRSDGDQAVIAGEVELAFRTHNRQLELQIAGRQVRTYTIRLTDRAPHTLELGAWQPHPDGSQIRYRAKWPQRE